LQAVNSRLWLPFQSIRIRDSLHFHTSYYFHLKSKVHWYTCLRDNIWYKMTILQKQL